MDEINEQYLSWRSRNNGQGFSYCCEWVVVAAACNGKANRRSGKVRTELSDYYKSYRHKTHFKFNLKPE